MLSRMKSLRVSDLKGFGVNKFSMTKLVSAGIHLVKHFEENEMDCIMRKPLSGKDKTN